jgi:hypothetical protein
MLLELLTTLKHAAAGLLLVLAEASGEPPRPAAQPPAPAPVASPAPAQERPACPPTACNPAASQRRELRLVGCGPVADQAHRPVFERRVVIVQPAPAFNARPACEPIGPMIRVPQADTGR